MQQRLPDYIVRINEVANDDVFNVIRNRDHQRHRQVTKTAQIAMREILSRTRFLIDQPLPDAATYRPSHGGYPTA